MARNRPRPRPGSTDYTMRCDKCETSVQARDMGDAGELAAQHNRVKHGNVQYAYPLCSL